MKTGSQSQEPNKSRLETQQRPPTSDPIDESASKSRETKETGDKILVNVGKMTESEEKFCPKHLMKECPKDRFRFLGWMPDVFFDYLSSCVVFLKHTLTWESFLILCNACGATIFYLEYQTDAQQSIAAKLDFSLVSVAVVFPLTFLLQQVFQRREASLLVLAEFRAILQNIAFSLFNWNFDVAIDAKGHFDGRRYLSPDFEERVLKNCLDISHNLESYLKEPEVTRARHIYVHRTQLCRGKRREVCLHSKFLELLDYSYSLVEEMKLRGMPANEAARINQYHWFLQARFERLRNFKWYRTPQPARTFGRIYLVLIPWFYGPYYAWAAGLVTQINAVTDAEESRTSGTTYTFAIMLHLFTSLVLLGLINASRRLEDPFTENGIDTIHVSEDLENMRTQLKEMFARLEKNRKWPRFEFKYLEQ